MISLPRALFGSFLAFIAAAILPHPQAALAAVIADSQVDWSASGTQGENDWTNGWRNFTADGGGAYDHLSQFIPFVNDGTNDPPDLLGGSTANNWTGSNWRLQDDPGGSGGPWTFLDSFTAHPNGTNSTPNDEHWTIRRWTADSITEPTQLELRSHLAAQNLNGPGTTVYLYQNGALLDSISNASGVGITNSVFPTVNPGDIFDLALSPDNGLGDRSDGSDGSNYSLTITDDPPPPPSPILIADSFLDWSATGTQGENGWSNGYYNQTQDTDATYQTADFRPFLNDGSGVPETDPTEVNHWNGVKWDFEDNPPWTEVSADGTHPNGDNNGDVHVTLRRWEANGLSGTTPLELNWLTSKSNPGGGNGVTGTLYVNGTEVDSATIAFDDTAGVDRTFLADINNGDIIELALSPLGTDGTLADGADGSNNRLIISQPIPEPATALSAMVAIVLLSMVRRRRE